MTTRAKACPECGARSTGKFCGECGVAMRRACPSCGADVPGGAKFCQECGASLNDSASSSVPAKATTVPWIAVGAAGVVLAVVGAFMLIDQNERETVAPAAGSPSSAAVTTAPNITPAQAAEQLFNHVMAASEAGDMADARRFAPMALDAYAQLETLDTDAHYHVGMIHVTVGDTASAERELGAIRRSVPDHLLGIMLDHAIAEAKGDDAGAASAFERFVAVYDTEILSDREEYQGHRKGIDGFHARAVAAQSAKN